MNKTLRLYTSSVTARLRPLAQRPVIWALLVVAGATFAGLVPAGAQEAPAAPTVASLNLGGTGNLAFFADKVRRHEPVVLAYLGGSITQGAGASGLSKSYYSVSQNALKAAIAQQGRGAVKVVTAAVGGTGSKYGAFRIGAQLLTHRPDLLVVEYAVNDHTLALTDPASAIEGMEGVVRQALRANPKMGIVFLYTTNMKALEGFYLQGLVPPSVLAHHQVARHYGLLEVLTGPAVAAGLKAGTFTDKTFFTDGTHPFDLGHTLYGQALAAAIIPALALPAPTQAPKLPAPLGRSTLEYARFDPVSPLEGGSAGWKVAEKPWYGVPKWISTAANQPLRFVAKGKGIQLIHLGRIQVEWTVNGQPQQRELTGKRGVPSPASFQFPATAMPDGVEVTVRALPDAAGNVDGEVWGLFSIQAP